MGCPSEVLRLTLLGHNPPIDFPDQTKPLIEKELDELDLNDDLLQSSNYYTLSEMNELKKK